MLARVLLLLILPIMLSACGGGGEKQWFKPGDYTVAEFERDRLACTKNKDLDEECLKRRGWLSLSGDAPPPRLKTIEERERDRLGPPGTGTGRY